MKKIGFLEAFSIGVGGMVEERNFCSIMTNY